MRKALVASTLAATAGAIGAAILVGRVNAEKIIVPELFRDDEPFEIPTDPYLAALGQSAAVAAVEK